MAAAYASLVSVMQILEQIKSHPRPPISLDEQQLESLTENVTFLQEFLEVYDKHVGYSTEADALEMSIADAAHAAEDVIESHIVDQILADGSSTLHGEGETSSVDFYQDLHRVIDGMELIKKEAMDVREKMGGEFHQQQTNSSTTSVGESRSAFAVQNRVMVGFDEILHHMLDKLTSQTSSREIISIAGMGGMGKTTLAMNIYQHQLVVERFDFLAWVRISQDYKISKIIVKLVLEGVGENLSQVEDVGELIQNLYHKLWGRRYLIILDDVCDIHVWDRLKWFFPDNNNGSRIMITTRLSNLASKICDSHNIHMMSFLDEDNSWKLFCKRVFGDGDCPLDLEGIGKKIVKGCKGLPLSISVMGGLLAKSEQTLEHWEQTAESLNSTVNSEHNDHCLQILYMSYNSLPLHLKPFFLYIGLLHQIEEIPIMLFRTWWVAEGFVKPICGKSIEEAADEYLSELIDRNLIINSSNDKLDRIIGECIINVHDMLRDLCFRESQKQNLFYYVGERRISLKIPHNKIRQICVGGSTQKYEVLPILESAHLLRSVFCEDVYRIPFSSISRSRLLRLAFSFDLDNLEDIAEHVNLRFIQLQHLEEDRIPSSISRFWNLQALMIGNCGSVPVMMPHEIWIMPQLRSVIVNGLLCLPDPPTDCSIILENLHTLMTVSNFKCSEEVVRKIPNIKFLGISYTEDEDYYLNNLVRLHRLQVLIIEVKIDIHLSMTYPHSLNMLILIGTRIHWDDLNTKIGSLPSLQSLSLHKEACIGSKWETIEDHFCSLRILEILECRDLEYWITDQSTHFPRLESLSLEGLYELEEIPSSIGYIPTLQLITVEECSNSVCDSAEKIREEQQDYGNEDLQVQVHRD